MCDTSHALWGQSPERLKEYGMGLPSVFSTMVARRLLWRAPASRMPWRRFGNSRASMCPSSMWSDLWWIGRVVHPNGNLGLIGAPIPGGMYRELLSAPPGP